VLAFGHTRSPGLQQIAQLVYGALDLGLPGPSQGFPTLLVVTIEPGAEQRLARAFGAADAGQGGATFGAANDDRAA
jgi:hypothetical protein